MVENKSYKLYFDDCLSTMSMIQDKIVDMVFCDLPYGTTQNKWDCIIPLESLWEQYNRIVKDNGAIVLTASQPFTSKLIMSNPKNFKFEWIWKKTVGSGQLNIKRQPLKVHESVVVFYKKPPVYNEIKTKGDPYVMNRKAAEFEDTSYGKQKNVVKNNDGFRYAKSIIEIANPRVKGGHPTQKPVALCEYFIKTYSNPGDLILDNCMGSGTTGVACLNTGRRFVGIENDEQYFKMAEEKLLKVKNEGK
jgi:site-specific DNA-methyltransferase (adenine-specific)